MVKIKYNELVVEDGFEILVSLDRVIAGPLILQRHIGDVVTSVVVWLEEVK